MKLKEVNQLKKELEKALSDNKATEIKSIDLKNKTSIADFMIIASGNSSKHIQSLAEILLVKLKENGKFVDYEWNEAKDLKYGDLEKNDIRIFARSASDAKGPVMMLIQALKFLDK